MKSSSRALRPCPSSRRHKTGREALPIEQLHSFLAFVTDAAILLFELGGVAVIIVTGAMGLYHYLRRDPLTRLKLAKGMSTGLEFKLGSEILRTVVVREFSEIMLVGAIIVLRAALTLLIHWEIKTEENAHEKAAH